jgi:hypothetical protein
MTPVRGVVRFDAPAPAVYEHLRRGVVEHCIDQNINAEASHELLTRYTTELWFGTVVTTERATLEPGESITWRHVDGPLTGSIETFRIVPEADGRSRVQYEGSIQARHWLFKGPLERIFVAPTVRRVSLGALEQTRRELSGGA